MIVYVEKAQKKLAGIPFAAFQDEPTRIIMFYSPQRSCQSCVEHNDVLEKSDT